MPFLVLGLGLFVLFDLVASDDAAYDSRVINVDRVHYVTNLVHALDLEKNELLISRSKR